MAFKYKQKQNTKDIDPSYYYSDDKGNKYTQQDLLNTGQEYFWVNKQDGTEQEYDQYASNHPTELPEVTITPQIDPSSFKYQLGKTIDYGIRTLPERLIPIVGPLSFLQSCSSNDDSSNDKQSQLFSEKFLDHVRIRNNTSSTSVRSQELEDQMHRYILDAQARRGENDSWDYAIPYLVDKEIKLTKGRYRGFRIPTNALDSLAKYAGITQLPIQTALGLAFYETKKGNTPYFNTTESGRVEGHPQYSNTDLLNAEYFKNFGKIPAENFVRDFEYTDGGYNNSLPITDMPPLQHAFIHYIKGRYNPGLGAGVHNKLIVDDGAEVWKAPEIKNWWQQSGKAWYNKYQK